jgi:hypothetical protein
MARRRVLLVFALMVIGVALVYLPYRIDLRGGTTELRSLLLEILLQLVPFTAAALIALSTPERVRPLK